MQPNRLNRHNRINNKINHWAHKQKLYLDKLQKNKKTTHLQIQISKQANPVHCLQSLQSKKSQLYNKRQHWPLNHKMNRFLNLHYFQINPHHYLPMYNSKIKWQKMKKMMMR